MDKGLTCKPCISNGLEVHEKADFVGSFDKSNAKDPISACSRLCVLLNMLDAQSSTETEHIALSKSLRETTPIMYFLREVNAVTNVSDCGKTMKCAMFQDNKRDLEISKTPEMRPRTNYESTKCHNFRSYDDKGLLMSMKIYTEKQESDFRTKPLVEQIFHYLRKKAMGL